MTRDDRARSEDRPRTDRCWHCQIGPGVARRRVRMIRAGMDFDFVIARYHFDQVTWCELRYCSLCWTRFRRERWAAKTWLPSVAASALLGTLFLWLLATLMFVAALVVAPLLAVAMALWLHARRFYRDNPDGSIDEWDALQYRRFPEFDQLVQAGFWPKER